MERHDSAKYAFFYVLSLVALVFMSVSVGIVIFQIINKEIVDLINDYSGTYSDSAIKFAISAIIISTPIYYFTSKQIYKNLRQGKLESDSAVRKWFTYLILLVSIIVMIVWLITTINGFLDGELTTKSILKTIAALFISGAVFSFYFYDIRREHLEGKEDKVVKIYFWISLVIVLAAFITSLFVVESPAETRKRKLDDRIIGYFNQIDVSISNYYNKNEKLPANMDEVRAESTYLSEEEFTNPVTGQLYEYRVVSDDEYELCTTFQYSSRTKAEQEYGPYVDKTWLHDAGYQCIKREVTYINNIKEPRLID